MGTIEVAGKKALGQVGAEIESLSIAIDELEVIIETLPETFGSILHIGTEEPLSDTADPVLVPIAAKFYLSRCRIEKMSALLLNLKNRCEL